MIFPGDILYCGNSYKLIQTTEKDIQPLKEQNFKTAPIFVLYLRNLTNYIDLQLYLKLPLFGLLQVFQRK